MHQPNSAHEFEISPSSLAKKKNYSIWPHGGAIKHNFAFCPITLHIGVHFCLTRIFWHLVLLPNKFCFLFFILSCLSICPRVFQFQLICPTCCCWLQVWASSFKQLDAVGFCHATPHVTHSLLSPFVWNRCYSLMCLAIPLTLLYIKNIWTTC